MPTEEEEKEEMAEIILSLSMDWTRSKACWSNIVYRQWCKVANTETKKGVVAFEDMVQCYDGHLFCVDCLKNYKEKVFGSGQVWEGGITFEDMVQCYDGHLFCVDCLKNYTKEKVFGSGQVWEGVVAFEDMVQCYDGHLFCVDCLKNYTKEKVFGSGQVWEGVVAFEDMVQCYDGHLFCVDCLKNYTKEKVFGSGQVWEGVVAFEDMVQCYDGHLFCVDCLKNYKEKVFGSGQVWEGVVAFEDMVQCYDGHLFCVDCLKNYKEKVFGSGQVWEGGITFEDMVQCYDGHLFCVDCLKNYKEKVFGSGQVWEGGITFEDMVQCYDGHLFCVDCLKNYKEKVFGSGQEDKPFKCEHCRYSTPFKRCLQQHMLQHTGERPFKCQYCLTETKKGVVAFEDMVQCYDGHLFCVDCLKNYKEKVFGSGQVWEGGITFEDMVQCYDGHLFCVDCLKNYKEKVFGSGQEDKPFKCEHCRYSTPFKRCLQQHMLQHTGERPFKCQYCLTETKKGVVAFEDMVQCYDGHLFCVDCLKNYKEKVFGSGQVWEGGITFEDMVQCYDGHLFCVDCLKNYKEKVFGSGQVWEGGITFEDMVQCYDGHLFCVDCLKNYKEKVFGSGQEDKPFKCEHCRYSTPFKRCLQQHMLQHTGERPFKCQYCLTETKKGVVAFEDMVQCYDGHLFCVDCLKNYKEKVFGSGQVWEGGITFEDMVQCYDGHLFCVDCLKNYKEKVFGSGQEDKPFKCEHCRYSTPFKRCLQQHMLQHTGERPFKCQYCLTETKKGVVAFEDMVQCYDGHLFCVDCLKNYKEKVFGSGQVWEGGITFEDMVQCYDGHLFCVDCLKNYKEKVFGSGQEDKPFKCEHCRYSTPFKRCLQQHMLQHTGERPFKCQYCLTETKKGVVAFEDMVQCYDGHLFCVDCLKNYKEKVFGSGQVWEGGITFEDMVQCYDGHLFCVDCLKNYKEKVFGSGQEDKPFKCEHCRYSTPFKRCLQQHMLQHTGERPFKCQYCLTETKKGVVAFEDMVQCYDGHLFCVDCLKNYKEKVFGSGQVWEGGITFEDMVQCYDGHLFCVDCLKNYKEKVFGSGQEDKPFKCEHCRYSTPFKRCLQQHMLQHTGERPFKCQYCLTETKKGVVAFEDMVQCYDGHLFCVDCLKNYKEKVFGSGQVWEGGITFEDMVQCYDGHLFCVDCLKNYKEKVFGSGQEDKPFKCEHCRYSTPFKRCLQQHMLQHTGERPFKCQYCLTETKKGVVAFEDMVQCYDGHLFCVDCLKNYKEKVFGSGQVWEGGITFEDMVQCYDGHLFCVDCLKNYKEKVFGSGQEDKPFKCEHCRYSTPFKRCLQQHMLQHTGERPFKCQYCLTETKKGVVAFEDMVQCYDGHLFCVDCLKNYKEKVFGSGQVWEGGITFEDMVQCYDGHLFCVDCLKNYKEKVFGSGQEDKPFKCEHCRYSTPFKRCLQQHMLQHTGERPFKCQYCLTETKKGVVAFEDMVQCYDGHLFCVDCLKNYKEKVFGSGQVWEGGITFEDMVQCYDGHLFCVDCLKNYKEKVFGSGQEDKPFKCEHCRYSTPFKRCLQQHMLQHTGERPFKCQYCLTETKKGVVAFEDMVQCYDGHLFCVDCLKNYKEKVFGSGQVWEGGITFEDMVQCYDGHLFCVDCLKNYKEKVFGSGQEDKPFKCEHCRYSTPFKRCLQQHMLQHTGERPFKCQYCLTETKKGVVAFEDMVQCYDGHLFCVDCLKNYKEKVFGSGQVWEGGITFEDMVQCYDGHLFCVDCLKNYKEKVFGSGQEDKPFKCEHCRYSTPFKRCLQQHMLQHTGERPFKCQYCLTETKKGVVAFEDMVQCYDGHLFCVDCLKNYKEKVFGSGQVWEGGITFEDMVQCYDGHLFCVDCLKNYKEKVFGSGQEDKPFKCEHCRYSTPFKRCLQQHMLQHTGERPFKCQYCLTETKKGVVAFEDMVQCYDGHLFCVDCLKNYKEKVFGSGQVWEGGITFEDMVQCYDGHLFCVDCLKNYKEKVFGSGQEDKPFKCEHCRYSTPFKRCLQQHMLQHTGERPFKCQYCLTETKKGVVAFEDMVQCYDGHLFCVDCLKNYKEKVFGSGQVWEGGITFEDMVQCYDGHLFCVDCLKNYKEKVFGSGQEDKPFKCEHCRYSTPFKRCLQQHMLQHTGERPFKCQYCLTETKKGVVAFEDMVQCYDGHLFCVDCLKNYKEKVFGSGQVDAGYTDSFDIVTGVRQGCVLSPLLFTVTIDFVMRRAMGRSDFGIPWEGDRRLTDLDFADDNALTAESQLTLQDMTTSAETEAGKVGLRISCQKTKVMQVGDQQTNTNLHISGEPVENVRQFTYLGSTMTAEGDTDTDISARIGKAASVFRRMNPVWNSGKISRVLKTKLLQSVVIPTALYACETWKITTRMRNKLDAFQQRCLRKILHITYRDRITNEEVYHRTGTKPLSITITERRMRYAGHVLRMTSDRHAKTSVFWKPEGKRKRGRPKLTWRRTLQKDLESRGITLKDAESLAEDRAEWRRLAAQCALHGRN
ncbi:hypothetical protein Bbelb_364770 [Branchiostoma belcheri]|nr:hypothetical protein Bbelb_364770 [Branchiostoma belcheri]